MFITCLIENVLLSNKKNYSMFGAAVPNDISTSCSPEAMSILSHDAVETPRVREQLYEPKRRTHTACGRGDSVGHHNGRRSGAVAVVMVDVDGRGCCRHTGSHCHCHRGGSVVAVAVAVLVVLSQLRS